MAKDRKIDMVILGILAHQDSTGYDIKKSIDEGIRFFWKGSFGSIYPALTSMESQGLVRKVESEKEGRGKIYYSITEEGRDNLRQWLTDERTSNELRFETLLKLFFGGNVKPEVTIHNIEVFEEQIEKELVFLKMCKDNLSRVLDEKDHLYFYLTASFGVDTCESYLKWCKESKALLKE